mgnify:CR=1 FL=1
MNEYKKDLIFLVGFASLVSGLLIYQISKENRREVREERLNELLEQSLKTNNLNNIVTENVIAGPEPEKFYLVNGQRVYLEIDGKPVEGYFRGK